jgi:hypothetical protein
MWIDWEHQVRNWFDVPVVLEIFYASQCAWFQTMPAHTLGSSSMKRAQIRLCLVLEKHHGRMDRSGYTPQYVGRWMGRRAKLDVADVADEQEEDGVDEREWPGQGRFSDSQKAILDTSFSNNTFPTRDQRNELGSRINRTHKQVDAWFQNKRKTEGITSLDNLPAGLAQRQARFALHRVNDVLEYSNEEEYEEAHTMAVYELGRQEGRFAILAAQREREREQALD